MLVTLIHNPEAGEGHPTPAELLAAFSAAGHRVRYASSREVGWESALDDPGDVVVGAGGDGTAAKLIPILAGGRVPLALLPLGTANNIALTTGLSRDWRRTIAGLAEATTRPFDCGKAVGPWGTGGFVESVGAGLFTHLMATADAPHVEAALADTPTAHRFGDIRRLCTLVLGDLEAADYEIDADGADLSGRYILVEAMNIRSIGPRMRLAPDADPGDGMLDLVLVEEADRHRFATHVETWLDSDDGAAAWPVRRARRVRIAGERLAWHVDDELRPVAAPENGPEPATGTVTAELTGAVQLLIAGNGGAR